MKRGQWNLLKRPGFLASGSLGGTKLVLSGALEGNRTYKLDSST